MQTRSDAKFDTARALHLRLQGLSYRQIAELCRVHPSAVHTRLKRFARMLGDEDGNVDLVMGGDLQAYRKHEADLLDAARVQLVSNMLSKDRLLKASVNNLAFAFTQLFNAGRLLRGQSTTNLGLRAAVLAWVPRVPPGSRTTGPDPRRQPARLRSPAEPRAALPHDSGRSEGAN